MKFDRARQNEDDFSSCMRRRMSSLFAINKNVSWHKYSKDVTYSDGEKATKSEGEQRFSSTNWQLSSPS